MSTLEFFKPASSFTLAILASEGQAVLPATADPARVFGGIAALDRAGPGDVSVFVAGDDVDDLRTTHAGACFVAEDHAGLVPAHTVALIHARPVDALGRVAALMHPLSFRPSPVLERAGIDRAAIIHEAAIVEPGVTIDPGVVIGPGAEIGRETIIGANSVIGGGVRIGRGCAIDSQVNIRCALIGDRVVIHAGVRIGIGSGATRGQRPTLGRVIIQNDAEIGANAVIERGRLGDTMIGERACVSPLGVVPADGLVERETYSDRAAFSGRSEIV